MNTAVDLQRTTRIIASLDQVKIDWQILQKFISYSSKMLFINKFLKNNKIIFDSNTVSHHRDFIVIPMLYYSGFDKFDFKITWVFKKIILVISRLK